MNTYTGTAGKVGRQKRAELTSAVGAGVLGGGLALLLAQYLAPYTVPLLVVGSLLHAWGMVDRHRLDRAAGGERSAYVRQPTLEYFDGKADSREVRL